MNLHNDEYSIHKTQVIVPDRVILFLRNWDSIQLNPHPPDSFYFSFNEKTHIEINSPELLNLLIIKKICCERHAADMHSRWAEDTGLDTEPADASQPYWIQIIIVRAEHKGKPRGRALCVGVFDRLCCRV